MPERWLYHRTDNGDTALDTVQIWRIAYRNGARGSIFEVNQPRKASQGWCGRAHPYSNKSPTNITQQSRTLVFYDQCGLYFSCASDTFHLSQLLFTCYMYYLDVTNKQLPLFKSSLRLLLNKALSHSNNPVETSTIQSKRSRLRLHNESILRSIFLHDQSFDLTRSPPSLPPNGFSGSYMFASIYLSNSSSFISLNFLTRSSPCLWLCRMTSRATTILTSRIRST